MPVITQFWGAQRVIRAWVIETLGGANLQDKRERGRRMLEEAMELAQASGVSETDANQLAAYVWSRPVGEPAQEIAGTLVTTLALAESHGVSAGDALQKEIDRIHTPEIIEKVRSKLVSKQLHGIAS